MLDASLTITANAPPAAQAAASKPQPGFFDHFLSELNPLQYVPVVGTIYRAITGDTIPESARFAGSLVVSGLTGGPIGIGINVGTTALEHLLGIDPEQIGSRILHGLGIGATPSSHDPGAPSSAASSPVAQTGSLPAAAPAPASTGWSPSQLAAYGISQTPRGDLKRGSETGADVLNSLVLAGLHTTTGVAAG